MSADLEVADSVAVAESLTGILKVLDVVSCQTILIGSTSEKRTLTRTVSLMAGILQILDYQCGVGTSEAEGIGEEHIEMP